MELSKNETEEVDLQQYPCNNIINNYTYSSKEKQNCVRKQIYENTKNCKMDPKGLSWEYGILSYYFATYDRYYPCIGSLLIPGILEN